MSRKTAWVVRYIFMSRLSRILHIYKRVCLILFDWVSLLYLIPLIIFSLIILREKIDTYSGFSLYTPSILLMVVLIWWGIVLFQALISPRIKVTSAEFLLRFLPVSMEKVLRMLFGYQHIIRFCLWSLMISLVYFLGMVSWLEGFWLLGIIVLVDGGTGVYQWLVFQRSFFVRLMYLLCIGLLLVVAFGISLTHIVSPKWMVFFICIGSFIVIWAGLYSRSMINDIEWGKVISYGDEKVWNPFIVKLITGVGFQQPSFLVSHKKKQSVLPLPYCLNIVIKHYWKIRFLEKPSSLVYIITNTLAIQVFLCLHLPVWFGILLSSLVLIFLLVLMFQDGIKQNELLVLPVKADEHVQGFCKAVYWIPLLFSSFSVVLFFFQGYNSFFSICYAGASWGGQILLLKKILKVHLISIYTKIPFKKIKILRWILVYGVYLGVIFKVFSLFRLI
ncbi:hypothetical protein [Desmospora activa]|uniref:Uncharacterized protein n=1 Tax=Desmospora activa DSM 45169 TaxID=1121389 RepID=A0A2T4Z7X2_9BACL|nr:hypothetical protein [Desmospora activa]PTM57992.1 hypothetical protein C8J48_0564 [Desmospora activa DSM 45169]